MSQKSVFLQLKRCVCEGDTFQFARLWSTIHAVPAWLDIDINECDNVHGTLLHFAMQNEKQHITQMLIQYGANVDAKGPSCRMGNTPLHEAVNKGNIKVLNFCCLLFVELLIAAKADLNIKNALGLTPLALACLNGDLSIVKILLHSNADVNIQDNDGKTAYLHAKENMHKQIMDLLPVQKWTLNDDPSWKMLVAKVKQRKSDENEAKTKPKAKLKANKTGKKTKKVKKKKKE
ncbi:ankyrin-repeat-containing protein [Reticulomyxa filosa]|uniref:Ankyrin-repeat-containing protein n=1 Tax=Reticulomyxa filosa TaxID=46433 RepID=X6M6N7_RETFI|nr:ankyrin-repeat-containing protein [Reticulomyxa filosa]|eukprot:ETO09291.1 ankyrin-repeat-containing protein [Reticulomyxa filosa]